MKISKPAEYDNSGSVNDGACLAGRRVLVTGASRGLGAVLVRSSWKAGAHVACVARSKEGLAQLQLSLPAVEGQQFIAITGDLAESEAPSRIFQVVSEQWGALDILVNNAGIQGPMGPAETNVWEEWEETIRVNLLAAVQLCRLSLPLLERSGCGRIINLSGGGATGPRPNFSAYATAKVGLVRFSETLAEEVRARGITVNCIAPGAMGTDMLKLILAAGPGKAGTKEYEAAEKAVAEGDRVLHRAADLAVFLASESGTGITGRLISAQWDPWPQLGAHIEALQKSDIYTLRRIVPRDRGFDWG